MDDGFTAICVPKGDANLVAEVFTSWLCANGFDFSLDYPDEARALRYSDTSPLMITKTAVDLRAAVGCLLALSAIPLVVPATFVLPLVFLLLKPSVVQLCSGAFVGLRLPVFAFAHAGSFPSLDRRWTVYRDALADARVSSATTTLESPIANDRLRRRERRNRAPDQRFHMHF